MVGLGRLELPTSRLSSARSNQLSYKPGTAPDPDHPGQAPSARPANVTPRTSRRPPAGTPTGQGPQPRRGCPRRKRNEDDEVPQTSSEELYVLSDPKVKIRDRLSQARPRKGPSLERR